MYIFQHKHDTWVVGVTDLCTRVVGVQTSIGKWWGATIYKTLPLPPSVPTRPSKETGGRPGPGSTDPRSKDVFGLGQEPGKSTILTAVQ